MPPRSSSCSRSNVKSALRKLASSSNSALMPVARGCELPQSGLDVRARARARSRRHPCQAHRVGRQSHARRHRGLDRGGSGVVFRRRREGWRATRIRECVFSARSLAREPRYRHYEGIRLDNGEETGAWLSHRIAAHELIYVKDALRCRRPPAPPRVLGRHPRGVPARGRHLPRLTTSTSRPRRPRHCGRRSASSSTRSSRAATGSRSPPAATSSNEPDAEPVIWTEAERAKGQAWGVKTVDRLPLLRHAADRRGPSSTRWAAGVAAP